MPRFVRFNLRRDGYPQQIIRFRRDGRTIVAYILDRESDPNATLWCVDVINPDVDYVVEPREIVEVVR